MQKRRNIFTLFLLCGLIFFVVFSLVQQKIAVPEKISVLAESKKTSKNIMIDDINVGNMSFKEAEKLLREHRRKNLPSLVIETPAGKYVFSFPQIDFLDNYSEVVKNAKKNGKYEAKITYFLNGKNEAVKRIVADNTLSSLDAEVLFTKEGFEYENERAGIFCDEENLRKDIENSLLNSDGKSFQKVILKTKPTYPNVSIEKVKLYTKKIASYTTYFRADDVGRCQNIQRAARFLDGITLRPKEELSFNKAVGERSKQRGFSRAKVIMDGTFISDYGGGVCQVSTTLYNAALLSGMEIVRRLPHSLSVSYIAPSRDAMVSSLSDLIFRNPHSYSVYLSVKTTSVSITATLYGKDEGYSYEVESVVENIMPPPTEKIIEGDFEGIIRAERSGIKSSAYLSVYRYGLLISKKKINSDIYSPIQGISGKKKESESEKTS